MSPEVFVVVLTTRSVTARASCRQEDCLGHAEIIWCGEGQAYARAWCRTSYRYEQPHTEAFYLKECHWSQQFASAGLLPLSPNV